MAKKLTSRQRRGVRKRKEAASPLKSAKLAKTRPGTLDPVQSERCLHMHCQAWLKTSGWWEKLLIFHVPNERRGGIGTVLHFKRLGVRPGVADYLIFGQDRVSRDAAIELKDSEGEQSESQRDFQRRWEAAGKMYVVVRTLEEFQGVVSALALFS